MWICEREQDRHTKKENVKQQLISESTTKKMKNSFWFAIRRQALIFIITSNFVRDLDTMKIIY